MCEQLVMPFVRMYFCLFTRKYHNPEIVVPIEEALKKEEFFLQSIENKYLLVLH